MSSGQNLPGFLIRGLNYAPYQTASPGTRYARNHTEARRRNGLQGPCFLKEVGGSGDNFEFSFNAHLRQGLFIKPDDLSIMSADDEKGRRLDVFERRSCQMQGGRCVFAAGRSRCLGGG